MLKMTAEDMTAHVTGNTIHVTSNAAYFLLSFFNFYNFKNNIFQQLQFNDYINLQI